MPQLDNEVIDHVDIVYASNEDQTCSRRYISFVYQVQNPGRRH